MLGRDSEAISAFRATAKLDPQNARVHMRLADLLRAHERFELAADCYERAADADPDSAEGPLNRVRARQMRGEHDVDQLEPLLRETVTNFPASAEAKRMLAALMREHGRFDEAIPLLEEATEGTPLEAATAYSDLVNSKRITQDDQVLVDQMLKLMDYGPLPEAARVWLNFSLGKAHNDLGRYDDAMRYYDAGNALQTRRRPFDRPRFGAGVERLIANTSKQLFDQNNDRGSSLELPLLIVGMPRSGTTLVEQILSSHRDVEAGGELPFWNNIWEKLALTGRTDLSAEYLQSVAKDYEAILRKIGPDALRVTDKTPGNFLLLGLFHLAFPHGRIIHLRRSAVDTCLSNYFVNFMAPMSYTYSKEHLVFYYRTYRRLMAHWRTVLPPEILLDVDYEALVTDPEPWTRRMIDFVGLPWDDACLRPQDNTRTVRTASQWQVRQPTNRGSVDRWRRYEAGLGALKALLRNPDFDGDVSPQTANPAIARARTLRRENRPDEAIAAVQAALRAEANDEVLYNELGTLFLEAGSLPEARECFERAIGLNPNFAVAHYNLAVVHERQGSADAAIAYHRRTLALDPRLGGAWSRLGNLLHAQGQTAEALECFRHAQTLLPNPAEQELEEAKILRGEDRDQQAEAKLNRVVALAPDNPMAHAMLGDILSEAGRFDEAQAHLRRAAELDPDRVTVLFNIAIFKKLTEEDRPLIARMESLLSMPTRTEIEKTLLNFALGKAYDDLNEPARAIRFYDAGNAQEHARQPFDRDAHARMIDSIIARYAQPTSAPDAAPSDRPVFIIGMPRSGTTLTEQILSSHPRIAGAGELIFWPEVAETAPVPVNGAAAVYLDRLANIAPDADRVTDKNPFNFLNLGLIHTCLPNARFVHCRRNPIDTCLSIYFTRFTRPQPFAYDRGDIAFHYRQYAA